MQKSIVSRNYKVFLRLFRKAREKAMLTQVEVAKKIGQSQSFVSKCERGERRIDVIELRTYCLAFGISFTDFTREFDRTLNRQDSKSGLSKKTPKR
jgi:transcriptional regulator with XRE-family HTH domain